MVPAANDPTSNNSVVYFATYHSASEMSSATGMGVIVTGQEYGPHCNMDCGNTCGTIVVPTDGSVYTWSQITTAEPNLRCSPVGQTCGYPLESTGLNWKKVSVETLCNTNETYYVGHTCSTVVETPCSGGEPLGTPLRCGLATGIENELGSVAPTAAPTLADIEVYTCADPNYGFHLVGQHDPDNFVISSEYFNVPDDYLNQHVFLWATVFQNEVYYGGMESSMVVSGASVVSTNNVLIYDFYGSPFTPTSGTHTIDAVAPCQRCPKPKPKPKPKSDDDNESSRRILSPSDDDSNHPKPKPKPPVPFHFRLQAMSDTSTNVACYGEFLAGVSYPRYSITTKGGKHVILSGPLCGNSIENVCEAMLPAQGPLEFRVFGFGVSPLDYQWEFCGERGTIGGGVDFELRDGKCVVNTVLTEEQDYALEYDIVLDATSALRLTKGQNMVTSNFLTDSALVGVFVAVVLSVVVVLRQRNNAGDLESEHSSAGPSSHGLMTDTMPKPYGNANELELEPIVSRNVVNDIKL